MLQPNRPVRAGWASFQAADPGGWQGYVDKRTGYVHYAEGAGIPWVPGRGNSLRTADIAAHLAPGGEINLATLDRIARAFLARVAPMMGVDPASLVLNKGRSEHPSDYLWFVDYDVTRRGMPVEGARVFFRVNHGNVIQFGSENLPPLDAAVPSINYSQEQARQALTIFLGGGNQGRDRFSDPGSLHLLPATINHASAELFEPGKGRGLVAVWQFVFNRPGVTGTWRARVDATTGLVTELLDVNEYGQVTGGVYLNSPTTGSEVVRPMPFANVAAGVFANSGGVFGGTTGTTTLSGQYVGIADSCGSISKAADASGLIAMGTSAGTDCTTPGTGGAGNTHSSRMQYYHVNRAKEVGRGWLPANSWLNAKLTVNVNLNQTCNAYWNGSTINFFRSGGGCGNTGELAGVSLHEYGHGLDSNDGNGSPPENGTGETYGDFTAALATHTSCVGAGFLGSNCGGYGNACTSCTGVRDIDFAKHTLNTPSTVANFTQTKCPQPSVFNPNYVGACGRDAIAKGTATKKREGHCESYVSSEALWDLANRDLPSPGTGSAWTTADRLWYLSRSTATSAFQCNTTPATWTSDGCVAGSTFRVMRAVDDDNGNLSDGTPHAGAIFAATNRHGMACATDTGANVTFAACTPPAVPALSLTGASNSVSASWTASGASVYDLYRNETGCNAGFTKVANDLPGTSQPDNAVANGFTYYYQVVAQPSGNEACASAPSACVSVTPSPAPCVPPSAPTGLTATAVSSSQINLSWTAVGGATEYHVFRSNTSGGPYSSVGTSTTATFNNTGLASSTTYYYVVRAANSATCESGNSNQASATTLVGPSCTTQTLYTNGFETGSGLSNWTKGTFLSGGSTTSWRGIQTCTAQTGTKIFRYGGTTCTSDYGNNNFTYAQPNGAGGISIPAGSTTARLSFGHRRNFETNYDGGTLTISTDGTNYSFVPASAIISGTTYGSTVLPDCAPAGAAGASIFTGVAAAFSTTTVDLDAACNAIAGNVGGCAGKAVRIGFTSISDCSVTGDGWFLDNVNVTACVP